MTRNPSTHARRAAAGLGVWGATLLGGCAALHDLAEGGAAAQCVEAGQPLQATLLSVIRSGTTTEDRLTTAAPAGSPLTTGLVRPEQVAVNGPDVYIADTGLGQVLRTDRFGTAFTNAVRLPATRLGGMAVDRIGVVSLAFPAEGAVIQVARGSTLERRLGQSSALSSPADVATDGADRLFVADALGARVVQFNRVGQVVSVIGERRDAPNPFTEVTAVSVGTDGLYVLDAAARRVHVVPASGAARTLDLGGAARHPVALAVDPWNRVFVADRGRRALAVLQGAAPALGDLGGTPPLQNVSDIAVDENGVLYVADSAAGSVYVLAVPRPCP